MPASATMKAVVLHGADDMRVETWPRPEPGPGEALLKVEVASICGTDVKVLHRTLMGQPAGPFVMGHEYAGTVVALGPGVDEFRVGGCVAGETVLVQGPGPIGLIAVQLCKALGAARVILTGTRDSRLTIGKRLGADFTINVRKENLAERVREITGGRGADCVLECAGGPTSMQEALENVKRGGRIGVVAWYAGPVEVDMNLAVRSNVRIYAARGQGGINSGRSLALMSAGKILADPIITHHFKLHEIKDAFHTYTERTDNALKVVIRV